MLSVDISFMLAWYSTFIVYLLPFELKFKQKIDIPTFNIATDKEHEKVTPKETKDYNLHHSIQNYDQHNH